MKVGLIAEFELNPRDQARFLAAAEQELKAVRESEPRCVHFDVILFDEKEGTGAFVEVFADQAAAEEHRERPHFKAFFEAIEDIEVNWTTRRGTTLS